MGKEWLPAGTIIRHYEIKMRIAGSGTGEVYLARDTAAKRNVALKLLPAPQGWDAERMEQLAFQLSLLNTTRHHNLCEFYEAGVTEDGRLFVASEYVKGKSLDQAAAALPAGAVCASPSRRRRRCRRCTPTDCRTPKSNRPI